MIKRIFLLVLDGLGIGPLPDAAEYGDGQANTLAGLAEATGGLTLPNLENLGLGHLGHYKGIRALAQPEGCFGRLGFVSKGKDSLAGHWELAGCLIEQPIAPDQEQLLAETVKACEKVLGRPTIGNRLGSDRGMMNEFSPEHQQNGAPILWLDGTGTIHLGAHEALMNPTELHRLCRELRKEMKGRYSVIRVVAHPFDGHPGVVVPTSHRRDFAVEPPSPTLLDLLSRASQLVTAVGKVGDLFGGRGITRSSVAVTMHESFNGLLDLLDKVPRGLLFANLDLIQHDVASSVAMLRDFDRRLPELQARLRPGDLLVLTADHGCDVTRPIAAHSREYVPLLTTGPRLPQGVSYGTRSSAADLGQTIAEIFGAARLPCGEGFSEVLLPV